MELKKVAEGSSSKLLSQEDFLKAIELPDFDQVSNTFDMILLGENVHQKLQRLTEHDYLSCSLMIPSVKMPGQGDALEMADNDLNV
jgi:hypothetical protein